MSSKASITSLAGMSPMPSRSFSPHNGPPSGRRNEDTKGKFSTESNRDAKLERAECKDRGEIPSPRRRATFTNNPACWQAAPEEVSSSIDTLGVPAELRRVSLENTRRASIRQVYAARLSPSSSDQHSKRWDSSGHGSASAGLQGHGLSPRAIENLVDKR